MLKSRETLPPGGFVYRQAQTNWTLPFGLAFDQAVDAIIKHRKANPRFNLSTDWNAVASELESFTEARLMRIPGAEIYLGAPDPKPAGPHQPSPALDAAVAGTNSPSIQAGIPVLINWLGEGLKPVLPELAVARAAICAGDPNDPQSKCPQNKLGDWKHWFTGPIAATLKLQMQIKNHMKLFTPSDGRLNVCAACACELKLKVWTPLKHIKEHLEDDMRRRLDERCWILHEQ